MPETVQDLFINLIPKLGGTISSHGNCLGITCAFDHYVLHGLTRFIDVLKVASAGLEHDPDNFYLEIKAALKKQDQRVVLSSKEKILVDTADVCKRVSFYQKESTGPADNFAIGKRLLFPTDAHDAQTSISGFSRVCTRAELAQLISKLKKLIKRSAHPVSINIGDDAHIMVIIYNPELGKWNFFDSNSTVGEWIDTTKGFSSRELSKIIKLALGSPKNCPFVASIIKIVYLSTDRDVIEKNVVRHFRMDTVGTGGVADVEKKAWCVRTKAPLFLTAITGEIGEFRVWLDDNGVDPRVAQAVDGWTCLHFSSYSNHSEIVSALLEAGVDPNLGTKKGNTALHLAVSNNHSDISRFLIEGLADVDRQNSAGNSALHMAAEKGYSEIVSLLIAKKANVDLLNIERYTALQLAVQNNHVAITDALISAGADVNWKDLRGYTALHIAIQYNNPEIVRALVRSVVLDPNRLNLDGDAALHMAVRYADSPQLVEALTRSRILDPNIEDRKGNTALHIATRLINFLAVQVLLEDNRVNPNIQNSQNVTPLQIAILQGDRKLVERFLDFPKVDVSIRTVDGKNLYELAQTKGEASIIELLSQHPRTQALTSAQKSTPGAHH